MDEWQLVFDLFKEIIDHIPSIPMSRKHTLLEKIDEMLYSETCEKP